MLVNQSVLTPIDTKQFLAKRDTGEMNRCWYCRVIIYPDLPQAFLAVEKLYRALLVCHLPQYCFCGMRLWNER